MAGVEVPQHIHGIPFLGDQAGEPRKYIYLHRDRNGENRETIRAIRDKRFRYVRNFRPDDAYIKPLAYRDRQAIMQELNRAIEQGTLGEDQWQFTARAKPLEEFYDTQADPYEIHNLAADPRHFAKMSEMRAALEAWIAGCDDPLDMPEDELVRTRVYPPDGEQPTTAEPTVRLDPMQGGRVRLTIACATEGASIGYRADTRDLWSIYDGPAEVQATGKIEVVAHRIGFKPSRRVVVDLSRR
jgi:hypothetical protein